MYLQSGRDSMMGATSPAGSILVISSDRTIMANPLLLINPNNRLRLNLIPCHQLQDRLVLAAHHKASLQVLRVKAVNRVILHPSHISIPTLTTVNRILITTVP